jgi:hypothetical protein
MSDLLVALVVFAIVAWVSYKYIPAPVGMIIAVVAGLVFLVKYLLPWL